MIGSRVRVGVLFFLPLLLMAVLTACIRSAPGPTPPAGDAVKTALNQLGVSTTVPTSRNAPTGAAVATLPSDYAPLGTTVAYGNQSQSSYLSAANPMEEVLLVGPTPTTTPSTSYQANLMQITGATYSGSTVNYGTSSVMKPFDTASHPWADAGPSSPSASVDANVQTLRSVATGDLDGDGLQELVAAYVAPPASAGANPTLKIEIIQDSQESYATTTYTVMQDASGITDVAVVTGDFNGNGTSDVAIAIAYADQDGQLLFLKGAQGNYQVDTSATKTFPHTIANSSMYFRLATGNLDYDRADELAIVVDELSSGATTGAANYYVYDDAGHGYADLASGNVEGTVTTGANAGTYAALAGDISMGDIDGDGLDEIVMGGPTQFETSCNAYGQIVFALDDAEHNLKPIGAYYEPNAAFAGCGTANTASAPLLNQWKVYFTFIKTVDLTGTGVPSILANQFLYDWSPGCATGLCPRMDSSNNAMKLPDTTFMNPQSKYDYAASLTPTRADVAVGDVTGDGGQNVIVYVQWHPQVEVWGQAQILQAPPIPTGTVSPVGDDGWAQLSSIPTSSYEAWAYVKPILVPTETEPSGPVMQYVPGSHQVVFTQPIVVAALAAAPCEKGINQNVSACTTTFGKSVSEGGGADTSVSVSAGVTVGVEADANIPFVGDFNTKWTTTMSTTATESISTSYTVTIGASYQTGSMEDAVVFTTIPYDQYTYSIVSAADSSLVGKQVVVSLPRQPTTIIAERSFYNAAVAPIPAHTFPNDTASAPEIDSTVFQHTIGDVTSYPTESQAASLNPLESQPMNVGEGTGSTQVFVQVNSQISKQQELALNYTQDFETTGQGYVFGFSVGYGASAGLTVTSGSSTTYTGTVGDIDAADFTANDYQYGLFTYVQTVGGQNIEVVNYWTAP